MSAARRRTRAETRELVVSAALDLVRERGLGVEPTTITYQKVFDHLEATSGIRITRASVHERLWPSQDAFQIEVLLRVSRMATGLSAAADAAAAAISQTLEWNSLATMREVARVAPDQVLEIAAADPLFYSWVGFTLSLAKDSGTSADSRRTLAQTAAAEYAETEERGAELVKAVADTIGVRPRSDMFSNPQDCYRLVAQLGLTLAEGATVRMRFDENELPDIQLMTGPDGAEQTWTAFAAGYWALLNTFLEIDPDAKQNVEAEEPA